ncbi:tRNA (mo5U34)-methyltransferase [Gammaproteobacteria bacterium]
MIKMRIEEKYGPWTAHNFSLGHDVFTIRNEVVGDEIKLRRIVQIVADVCRRPTSDLKVLDLACLEGMYSIEFASQGARVCAIEGRETNLEKARFAAQVLALDNIVFHHDDVRNLREETHGRFDVVLCLGILYHLNDPDIFSFLENVFTVCQHVALIDTHISLHPVQSFVHKGKTYWGTTVDEHAPEASLEEKQKALWASLDNQTSTYFTQSSLYDLLYDIGFTSVYECHVPQEPQKPSDRITIVAIKGKTLSPVTCPQLPPEYARFSHNETTSEPGFCSQYPWKKLWSANRFLPRKFKHWVKRMLR